MNIDEIVPYPMSMPAKDDWDWALEFIAEWVRIDPSLEADFMEMRDSYMTEPEIAHCLLDAVGRSWAANAPILSPPSILEDLK